MKYFFEIVSLLSSIRQVYISFVYDRAAGEGFRSLSPTPLFTGGYEWN
jgi:hypothetical protein